MTLSEGAVAFLLWPVAVMVLWFVWRAKCAAVAKDSAFLEGMNQGRYEGYGQGREETLAEVEEMREEKNVGYREAALIIQKKCAVCGKKCLHCAKKADQASEEAKAKRVRVADDLEPQRPAWQDYQDKLDPTDRLPSQQAILIRCVPFSKDGGAGK